MHRSSSAMGRARRYEKADLRAELPETEGSGDTSRRLVVEKLRGRSAPEARLLTPQLTVRASM
ncbi:hypothetical protein [Streptosporangium amethystogenes]|uniref:hypothetical protein n=1 Tax=Streptosporangium amethystogenes TaxID=2002 RepID=UPI0004C9FA45|nr:hypothetical protein [Streptosporangium amethystogenes]